jgi:hypothetical protein
LLIFLKKLAGELATKILSKCMPLETLTSLKKENKKKKKRLLYVQVMHKHKLVKEA